jgi:DNA-binding winged helix-turn-helix (wHTH) protein
VTIRLTPQPARVLLLLVERAGEIVTRKEIQGAAWSSDTVVDFELGLNRCIGRIRAALLDDANSPRYIETVPRIGYRFIAPVLVPEQAAPVAVTSPDPTRAVAVEEIRLARRPPVWQKVTAGAACILLVAAVIVTRPFFRKTGAIQGNLTVEPLANELGAAYTPAFSPDGRQIAFVWNGRKRDNFDIYIKPVASQEFVRLTTNPEMDYSPAWSPDGRFVAFCRGNDRTGGAIWLISPLGGAERKLIDLHTNVAPDLR